MLRRKVLAIALALGAGGVTLVAAAPADKCEQGKNTSAGSYAECREKAEAKFALTGNAAARGAALTKCEAKYARDWAKHEATAGGACPSAGDAATIRQLIDDAVDDIATELAGGSATSCRDDLAACLAACPPTAPLPATGQSGCWSQAGTPIPCAGTGQDGELQTGLPRSFVDNGDGTITDATTGLTWEKLAWDDGVHDWTASYGFEDAFAIKLAALNAGAFAGHTDWRLPNLTELSTLRNIAASSVPTTFAAFDAGCVPGCTTATCSCTGGGRYWSSSTHQPIPERAWAMNFTGGATNIEGKGPRGPDSLPVFVRAVRGGS